MTLCTSWRLMAAALALCLSPNVSAEPLELTFGGAGKDGVRKMIRAQDGGFALAGWQDQEGAHDKGSGLVVRLDESGAPQWQVTLSTTGRNQASGILQRADGAFVAVVEEYPTPDAAGQVVLIELSATGDIVGEHRVGGPGNDVADSILRASDGGYILAGESAPSADASLDAWIAKLSPGFEVEWEWRQGTPGRDRFNALVLLPDGSMIAAGNATIPGPNGKPEEQAWFVKLDAQGDLVWSKTPALDRAASVRGLTRSADGGFIFAGFSKRVEDRSFDSWIGKVTSEGELVWQESMTFGGADYLHSVTLIADGRYAAAGAMREPDQDYDALIVEFTEDGKTIEPRPHRQSGAQQARVVLSDGDDGLVLAGAGKLQDTDDEQMWFLTLP